MLPIRNISFLLPMCCNFWEKCINSQKTGLGCSTPLNNCFKSLPSYSSFSNDKDSIVLAFWSVLFSSDTRQAVQNTSLTYHTSILFLYFLHTLRAHNWQKWKRVFLTCPCLKSYRDEAVGLKSCKYTWKITIFVKMWNLGQYRENLIFCQ